MSVNGVTSDPQTISNGSSQGSILGSLLYLCYSNDMALATKSKIILYADDTVILVSDKSKDKIEKQLSSDLECCNSWRINNLALHPAKCESKHPVRL